MDTYGQAGNGFGGKPIQLTLTPGGEWNGMVGVLEKWMGMAEELSAYHERDLTEAKARSDEAMRQLEEEKERSRKAEEALAGTQAVLETCRARAEENERERARLETEKKALEEDLHALDQLRDAWDFCAEVCVELRKVFGERQPTWYTEEFEDALCHALMSVWSQLKLQSPFVSPTEIMLRIDKAFHGQLGATGGEMLEQARQVYMGWFNEQAGDLYQIRWPERGSEFDSSYCVREEDNGFTGVLLATSCAVYKGGQLTERARVKTVAR